ncbi:FtsH protease activity modulator HflK [Leadbettera azotonutricia]|uniref:Protein HflK n=1 Tax=Leadbettera azotonutricia (strain ATCC BAA-888 / DSM 13862 / ZAS-9) TaxID=545695 RepID=F5YEY8_LEAAZ|nr:FtsH protease activity modulator HflK [Leadbettera azotonutricia]AEF81996.1 HflK protein [Leadbettera azotonutricia ZAS-9]
MAIFTPPKAAKFLNPGTIALTIIVIAVLIFLFTSFYIVDQTEEAIVTRFGRYSTTTGPGLHYKLPFGIDKQYIVNVKSVQTEQFGFRTLTSGISATYSGNAIESTMLTGDLNIVTVEWIIQYRIVDPMAWTFNVNERSRTIRDVSRSAINMLVGDRAIMDIMGPERSAIEAAGAEFMNETFRGYGLGIDVIAVKLQNIDPPQGVQEAFDDVNKAEQDMNRLINEGQQVYNEEIPRARGERERLIQEAQGYAAERVNKAIGDVARFNAVFEEYRRAPEVTRQRLYYEMIEEVFKDDKDTVIIDRQFNNFLPLRNLGGSASEGGR